MKLLILAWLAATPGLAFAGGAVKADATGYDKAVTLKGILIREWDMSWTGTGDTPNTEDPKVAEAARVEGEAEERKDGDFRPRKPSLHYILRLDEPISIKAKAGDEVDVAETGVKEVDVQIQSVDMEKKIADIGKTQVVVTGTLFHAHTVHHLRPILIKAAGVERLRL